MTKGTKQLRERWRSDEGHALVLETFRESLEIGGSIVINARDFPRIGDDLVATYHTATDDSSLDR